jgi:uncharacterized membrane protein
MGPESQPPPQGSSPAGAALPDHISQNIDEIVELQRREASAAQPAQLQLERLGRLFAQPQYFVAIIVATVAWVAGNLGATRLGLSPLDRPPFPWLDGFLSFVALLTTTVVLIGQRRQTRLAEQRAHLDLQINLLTEQKVTKLIHLLEELRRDLPMVRDRTDPHASALKEPTDTAQVLSALKKTELDSEDKTDDSRGD